jgi:hypothetical protein
VPVGPAGLSAYHAAWQAADASGPRLGLQLADGSVVLEEASLIVEGDHIAGPISSTRISPTPRRSICAAALESATWKGRADGSFT